MSWFRTLAAGALALSVSVTASAVASAADMEKPSISIGVGGKPLLYYLPLTVAERLGYFKEQGLDVAINDFPGGGQALQSLIGGSVDIVVGAYDATIRMQAKGQDVRAFVELGRLPGHVLAIKKELADEIKKPGDLKGRLVGVSAPGSQTHQVLNYLIAKDGLKPTDVSVIAVGTGATAIAAMKRSEIAGLIGLELAIASMEREGTIKILVDTRTEEGTRAVFGGPLPAGAVYTRAEFLKENPKTTQAVANAFMKALAWIGKATPDQIADVVPAAYQGGDRDLYIQGVKAALPGYSKTGIIGEEGMQTAMKLLSFDKEIAAAKFDVHSTFDDHFVKAAKF